MMEYPCLHPVNRSAEPSGRNRAIALLIAFAAGASPLAPAAAQGGAPIDSVGEDALDAVTQPLSDLGLRSRDIPLILLAAQDAPYTIAGLDSCEAVRNEIVALEETLGPDADDEDPESSGLINQGLNLGGNFLSGFIPFRGLIRQVSGAKAEEKRWEVAVYAGVARRSFLKGYAAGQSCPTERESGLASARNLLGLEPVAPIATVELRPFVPEPAGTDDVPGNTELNTGLNTGLNPEPTADIAAEQAKPLTADD